MEGSGKRIEGGALTGVVGFSEGFSQRARKSRPCQTGLCNRFSALRRMARVSILEVPSARCSSVMTTCLRSTRRRRCKFPHGTQHLARMLTQAFSRRQRKRDPVPWAQDSTTRAPFLPQTLHPQGPQLLVIRLWTSFSQLVN